MQIQPRNFLPGRQHGSQLQLCVPQVFASGRIVHLTVASLPLAQRADVTLIPTTGLPPLPLGLIWCTAHENARIRALRAGSCHAAQNARWCTVTARDARPTR